MPRGFSIVFIPSSTPANEIGKAVSALLNPHASYLEPFEPYHVPCPNCVETSDEGIQAANQQVGDFHRLWHLFRRLPDDQCPEWKDYIAPWEETTIASALSSPCYRPADPQCKLCRGTGVAIVKFPVSGIRYESRAMAEREWVNLGSVKQFREKSDEFEILVTPDGQAYYRWSGTWSSQEKWETITKDMLAQNKDCITIKVLINI